LPKLDERPHVPVTHVVMHQRLALFSTIRALQSRGKKVMVWTVNGAKVMQRLARWGVDGIISDDTEKLVRTLGTCDLSRGCPFDRNQRS
jgi:glycerophosphoryl diester phosphodiesterase